MTGDSITPLDLNATVSRRQYEQAVTRLHEALQRYASYDRKDWCEARHAYFARVIPEYQRPDRNDVSSYSKEAGTLDFGAVPRGAGYAERLREIRGRVLYYASDDPMITVEEAQELLAAAGLPPLVQEEAQAGHRIRVLLRAFYVRAHGADGNRAAAFVERSIADAFRAGVDAADGFVPGSLELEAGRADARSGYDRQPPIARSEIVAPYVP